MASSGNFCTFNETYKGTTSLYDHNLSVGNTRITQSNKSGSNHACGAPGTHLFQSGKFYWEAYMPANQTGGSHNSAGILNAGDGATKSGSSIGLGITTGDIGINPYNLVVKFSNVQTKDYSESAFSSGDILQVAVDADNGAIYFGKNNTFLGSSDPTSGSSKTNAGATWTPSSYAGGWVPSQGCEGGNGNALYMNWGQDSTFGGARSAGGNADENGFGDFVYSPPSGYLALCSANLPTSSDIDPAQTDDDYPSKQFNTVLYTGNGSTNAISGLGFQPDLVFFQRRSISGSYGNGTIDSSRGVTKGVYPNRTEAEANFTNDFASFDSDGFTLNSGSSANINNPSKTFVAWCWRANGGTTASNSDGSITSTVQSSTSGGFSICTYTGNATNGATFGHGLSAKPSLVFIKNRDASQKWGVWHQSMTQDDNKILFLNESSALTTEGTQRWDVSAISSSVFGLGSHPEINGSGADYVAYIWHDVEGYQKFSSYKGNGNSDGPFVYTGFRPRMLFLKRTDGAGSWQCHDSERDTHNPVEQILLWNTTDAEFTSGGARVDFLSNGFKLRHDNAAINASGGDFVFGAWGDVPFKYNNTF